MKQTLFTYGYIFEKSPLFDDSRAHRYNNVTFRIN